MTSKIVDFKTRQVREGGGGDGPSPPTETQEVITESLLEYLSLADIEELSGIFIAGIDTKGRATKPMIVFDKSDTLFKLQLIVKEVSLFMEDQATSYIEPRPDDGWEGEDL